MFVHDTTTTPQHPLQTVYKKTLPQIGDDVSVIPSGWWSYIQPFMAPPYLLKSLSPLSEDLKFEEGSPYDVIMKDLEYWLSPECDRVMFPSRSYIMHGPPGTGKSTIGYAIGNALSGRVPVFFYRSGYDVSSDSMVSLQTFGVKNALIIIDECDAADDLSGLLDCARIAGFAVIMTTNNFDALDENVRVRPGRCDRKFEVAKPPRQTLINASLTRKFSQSQAEFLADKYESMPLAVLNELAFRLAMGGTDFETMVEEVVGENQFDIRENEGPIKRQRFQKKK